MSIRTRIAPSPTGLFHIGTLRTGLFNYLFTRQNKGTFILRIEDTDKERSKKEYEEDIVAGFKKMGIDFDEGPEIGGNFGPYRQSERISLYKQYLEKLLKEEKAYYCFCSEEEIEKERAECMKNKLPPRYSGKCRNLTKQEIIDANKINPNPVIRIKVPENTDICYHDLIRGDQKQNTKDLTGDFVIAKDLNTPLYNYTVVIDDALMEISHVMRGEDHISNTPKQILIYQALGFKIPLFAHFPLILNPDKTKLSKRKNPVSVSDYLEKGYLKEALINFLALLGWNPGTTQEIFELNDLIASFSIEKINKAGAVFDMERLNWVNSEHLRKLSPEEFTKKVIPYLLKDHLISVVGDTYKIAETEENISFEDLVKISFLEQKRIKVLSEIPNNLKCFFLDNLNYDKSLLLGKDLTAEKTLNNLKEAITVISDCNEFTEENLKNQLIISIQNLGIKNGEMLWPIRAALSGQEKSPGAFEILSVLGKEKSLKRIQKAISLLEK